ncbi:hypothetical protein WY02_03735 [Pseudonocardia sp. AL041005-10]|nr:hypothetical protein [Pseudonocardia sp. AL041005-10]ALE77704.1 hypothetical protein WY02_03735 [Pseudonocardia sp. AL041005-10]
MTCSNGYDGLPDAGEGACCTGAAVFGPDRCTCWREVLDREQATPVPGPAEVRDGMCSDCAYRPASPERTETDGYAGDPGALEANALAGRPFYCHDGMARVQHLEHPTGVTVDGHPADYAPPIRDGVPYRADGRPALVCAGYDARRRRHAARPPVPVHGDADLARPGPDAETRR